jgi:starch synthase
MAAPLRILYVTSECAPWVKTGGLADVSAALPPALEAGGADVRVLMPAYGSLRPHLAHSRLRAALPAHGPLPDARLIEAPLPSGVPAWLVDAPSLYGREGNPYLDDEGLGWPDNARRFAALARAAADLAGPAIDAGWRPDVIHCHDWQAALAPAYVHFEGLRAATVMTVHNLAFQGLFPAATLAQTGLPPQSWSIDGVEYFGQVSFLKAGLQYADALTTVSPTYATEIQEEPQGMGMQGLLAARRDALTGILNGVDTAAWDPSCDPLIPHHYDAIALSGKAQNKRALQARAGLPEDADVPLLAIVSRLTEQKGIDFVLEIGPALAELPAQLVVLGAGDRAFEAGLRTLAQTYPQLVSVTFGFDEAYAHLIEAGADIFLMPSRFEPCGMNQMYSQRYGTVPVVHGTGGLLDSVVDCTPATLADHTASGFVFREPSAAGLRGALERAIGTYENKGTWRALQRNGMARDFGWAESARRYLAIYRVLTER